MKLKKILTLIPNIRILYLGDLGLVSLPKGILNLKNLRKLYFNNLSIGGRKPNHFTKEEQNHIRGLLHGVEVKF